MSVRVLSKLWIGAYVLIAVCFCVIMYVNYLRNELVDCLNDQTVADQRRTSAIAKATDAERVADLALIRGAGDRDELRRKAIAARELTDQVRRDNPAPAVRACK